jgi:hypothetical protein
MVQFRREKAPYDTKLLYPVDPVGWTCWFMFENCTTFKCEGTIEQIIDKLKELFDKDKYGLWGYVGHKAFPGWHICDADGKVVSGKELKDSFDYLTDLTKDEYNGAPI